MQWSTLSIAAAFVPAPRRTFVIKEQQRLAVQGALLSYSHLKLADRPHRRGLLILTLRHDVDHVAKPVQQQIPIPVVRTPDSERTSAVDWCRYRRPPKEIPPYWSSRRKAGRSTIDRRDLALPRRSRHLLSGARFGGSSAMRSVRAPREIAPCMRDEAHFDVR